MQSLAAYQQQINAALGDAVFVARVQHAARNIHEQGWGVVPECVPDRPLLDWAHTRWWQVLGQAAPVGSTLHGRTQAPTTPVELARFRVTKDWPPNKHGILEPGELSHIDFVHPVRLHPRVAAAYALLYGAERGLIAAPDRFNYQLPPELLPPHLAATDKEVKRWADMRPADPSLAQHAVAEASSMHHDQSFLKQGLHCVQGLVVMVDADMPGDASLEIVSGSHRWHDTMQRDLRLALTRDQLRGDWYMLSDADKAQFALEERFAAFTQVRTAAGSLVLWDSRALHKPGRIRAHPTLLARPFPRSRFVIYTCMQPAPAEGLTLKQVARKRAIFEKRQGTSHWPLKSKAFGKPWARGKPLPVFTWPTVLLAQHDGTAAAELYGLTRERTLQYVPAGTPALLPFVAPVAAPVRGKKRKARDE